LAAVTAHSNRQKSDAYYSVLTFSTLNFMHRWFWPCSVAPSCWFVQVWLRSRLYRGGLYHMIPEYILTGSQVKHYYKLTVDSAEKSALSDILSTYCWIWSVQYSPKPPDFYTNVQLSPGSFSISLRRQNNPFSVFWNRLQTGKPSQELIGPLVGPSCQETLSSGSWFGNDIVCVIYVGVSRAAQCAHWEADSLFNLSPFQVFLQPLTWCAESLPNIRVFIFWRSCRLRRFRFQSSLRPCLSYEPNDSTKD